MYELRNNVQRLTAELNLLMRQLSGADDTQARALVEEMLKGETLADFKSSVDAMRHLLWIYVEAVSKTTSQASMVQSARLQKAVDMLRALHSSPVPEQFNGAETFFEHVQHVVDGYGTLKKKTDAA